MGQLLMPVWSVVTWAMALAFCWTTSANAIPLEPVEFTAVTEDPSTDCHPVTASFSLTPLDNPTIILGIDLGIIIVKKIQVTITVTIFKFGPQGQIIFILQCRIIVILCVICDNGRWIAFRMASQPNSFLDVPNLPACAYLRATLSAESGNESSSEAVSHFSTLEPSGPVDVGIYSMMPSYLTGSNISLVCLWNTSVYYASWFKNGALIYEEDLASPSVLMTPPNGITVNSDYAAKKSNLIIAEAALGDSGNYTCAVTCGAKGVEFGRIAENLQDTFLVHIHA